MFDKCLTLEPFIGCHDSQPITEVVLLQVLLCQVLKIPFGELLLRRDVDLVLHAADLHCVAQVPCLSVDLYPLFKEDFKVCRVQDPILHRVGQVQGELPWSSLFGLPASSRSLLFELWEVNKKSSNIKKLNVLAAANIGLIYICSPPIISNCLISVFRN